LKALTGILILCLCLFSSMSIAREDVQGFSLEEAMGLEESKTALGDDIKFYFGDQVYGETERNFGEFKTNKKTNAFNKSDLQACQRAFLSAMLSLKDRAVREGGNAVVNIRSNYKNDTTSSETEFRCGAGAFVAGVALIGTVVTLN
jgi:uncharacterized protein YbjQ (UPF0145 family)